MLLFCLKLPFVYLKFWFWEAPKGLISYFASLNKAFLHLFSVALLLKTFFKPLKNEYRDGLVGFSIGMGMFVKTILIFVSVLLLSAIVVFELAFILIFITIPIATIAMFFI